VSSEEQPKWHLHIQGKQRGPLTVSQVYDLIDSNVLKRTDQVWEAASGSWRQAEEIFEFSPSFAQPLRAKSVVQSQRAQDGEKRWYRDFANLIAVLSLLATIVVGLLSVPFLSDYWQQNLVSGPLDGYKNANAAAFLLAYEGEWCPEGATPGIPGRMRISKADATRVRFEFGNLVAPMSIPGSTAEPQFIKTNEGTSKRLLTDGKSAFFVEFDSEIFAGIVTYEQLFRDGARTLWRRYYIKDNKNELIFQAELKRCS
jgi:hypothetical protein